MKLQITFMTFFSGVMIPVCAAAFMWANSAGWGFGLNFLFCACIYWIGVLPLCVSDGEDE